MDARSIKVGDTITYEAFGGERRRVVVETVSSDIKNGRPGFDGHVVGDPEFGVWGYLDQVVGR